MGLLIPAGLKIWKKNVQVYDKKSLRVSTGLEWGSRLLLSNNFGWTISLGNGRVDSNKEPQTTLPKISIDKD